MTLTESEAAEDRDRLDVLLSLCRPTFNPYAEKDYEESDEDLRAKCSSCYQRFEDTELFNSRHGFMCRGCHEDMRLEMMEGMGDEFAGKGL